MEMFDFAVNLARAAGNLCLNGQKQLNSDRVHVKGTPNDLVTDVDRAVERFLVEQLSRRYPGCGFFGEEYGRANENAEYRWVIDPIDGTCSFVRDLPYFSISIALQRYGETVAGLVYAPRLGELFTAVLGEGAFLNGRRIRTGSAVRTTPLLATGFACLRAELADNNLRYLNHILARVRDVRRGGSAALDMAYVACGRYDGFWELALNLYDVAAGILLVTEAGGTVCDMNGKSDFPASGILCGDERTVKELLADIAAVRSGECR